MAGVIFSLLMFVILGIIRFAVPAERSALGAWLADPVRQSALDFAFSLAPLAGIAFLWFIGVLRDRLEQREDRFFATVFLGSGLLFVASLFCATAIASAFVKAVSSSSIHSLDSETYHFARRAAYAFLNIFAIKMAAMFTFSTCTIALRTALFPRWLAYSGFACGLVLLLAITSSEWIALLFPAWMLLVSAHILAADLKRGKAKAGGEAMFHGSGRS